MGTRVIWEVETSKKNWAVEAESKQNQNTYPQHLGDAAQKCTTASQKHLDYGSKEYVVVDCQVDAAQKCGIDVARLLKPRLRRTSFVSKHIKGSTKMDGGVGKQNHRS